MNHTVLVVEDDEELRETMRDALELNGYTVVAAHDGQEAVEELDRIEQICVILLDLQMPRMNGWDFFKNLRGRPEFAEVPVVVHSSSPSQAPAGVTRVLRKPLQLDGLLKVVQEFCNVS